MVELLVATTLLGLVSSIAIGALVQMTAAQGTIANRTAMHSGVRGATELIQQEIGQAGLITLPETGGQSAKLTAAAAAAVYCDPTNPTLNSVTVSVNSVAGMFVGIKLTTLDGDSSETVVVIGANPSPPSISACFSTAHAANVAVTPFGGFATGILPPGMLNGSTAEVLKLYGDINGDGEMIYVEYTCDYASQNLYRNAMLLNSSSKPAVTSSQILLTNIVRNPGTPPTPCFTYQTSTITVNAVPYTFVLDVALTLTVETEQIDPTTRTKQLETKALLNVSPRNIFNAWAYAGMGYSSRIQATPPTVINLLP